MDLPTFLGIAVVLGCIAGAAMVARAERRHRRALAEARLRRPPPLLIPPAEEIAASVERFREAVRRFERSEASWEHWVSSRLLPHGSRGLRSRP